MSDSHLCNQPPGVPLDLWPLNLTAVSTSTYAPLISENEKQSCGKNDALIQCIGFGWKPFEQKLAINYCLLRSTDPCCQSVPSSREPTINEFNVYSNSTDTLRNESGHGGLFLFVSFCGLITLCSWLIGFSVCSSFLSRKRTRLAQSEATDHIRTSISSEKTLVNPMYTQHDFLG